MAAVPLPETVFRIIVDARPAPKSYNVRHKVRNPPPPTYLVGSVLHGAERLHAKRRRVCQHCRMTGVTTSSGHGVETSWNCVTCDVALCVNNRNCWNNFHDKLNNIKIKWHSFVFNISKCFKKKRKERIFLIWLIIIVTCLMPLSLFICRFQEMKAMCFYLFYCD